MADTEPFVKDNPLDPSNRRISIMLQFQTQAPLQQAEANPQKMTKAAKPGKVLAKDHAETVQTASVLDEAVFENLRSALR